MAKYWLFRLAAVVIPLTPFWLAYPLAQAAGWLFWAVAAGPRRRVERNLRHIPALASDPRRLTLATRGAFQHLTLNYLDFFRGRRLTDDELRAGWTIEHQDLFEAAIAQGKGVILVSGHLGNFEYAASRLGAIGYRVVAPVERLTPPALFDLFCQLRQHHNLRLVPADNRDALRELLDALKRNEVLVFLVDRHILGATADVPFFDAPASLPTGPFSLALRSGAPILGAHSWREEQGRSHGLFLPLPLDPPTDASSAADEQSPGATGKTARSRAQAAQADRVTRLMRAFTTQLEEWIGAHPEQWVATFSTIWPDAPTAPAPTATHSTDPEAPNAPVVTTMASS